MQERLAELLRVLKSVIGKHQTLNSVDILGAAGTVIAKVKGQPQSTHSGVETDAQMSLKLALQVRADVRLLYVSLSVGNTPQEYFLILSLVGVGLDPCLEKVTVGEALLLLQQIHFPSALMNTNKRGSQLGISASPVRQKCDPLRG